MSETWFDREICTCGVMHDRYVCCGVPAGYCASHWVDTPATSLTSGAGGAPVRVHERPGDRRVRGLWRLVGRAVYRKDK